MVIDLLSFRPDDVLYIMSDAQRYHGYEIDYDEESGGYDY
jgi:hypothetical protein